MLLGVDVPLAFEQAHGLAHHLLGHAGPLRQFIVGNALLFYVGQEHQAAHVEIGKAARVEAEFCMAVYVPLQSPQQAPN